MVFPRCKSYELGLSPALFIINKMYINFSQLPEPILTFSLYEEMISFARVSYMYMWIYVFEIFMFTCRCINIDEPQLTFIG